MTLTHINQIILSFMKSPIQSLYWLTAGIIGPHLGAIIGAWVYQMTIYHNTKEQDNDRDNNSVALCDTSHKKVLYKANNNLIEDSDKCQPLIATENEQNDQNPSCNQNNPVTNGDVSNSGQNPNSNIASDGTKNWYEINDSSITILSTPKQMQSKSISSLDSSSDSDKNNVKKNY